MRPFNDRPTSLSSAALFARRVHRQWFCGVALLLLIPCFAAAQQKFHRVEMRSAPIAFVPNGGQATAADRFTAKSGGYTVALRSSGATIRLAQDRQATASDEVSLTLLGANPDPALAGQNLLRQRNSFFPTGDPKSWIVDVPSYGRVEYSAVYKGINLAFYGNESRLEYDFAVAPGGDTRQIALALDGATRTRISESGDLLIDTGGGKLLRLLKPAAYQVSADGKRHEPVSATYQLQVGSRATLKFEIGSYDHARPLVIDPVLVYGEVLSGSGEAANAMTTDAQGNLYLANSSGALMKFDSTGTPVLTASFGNNNGPDIFAVAVDKVGNIYLTGQSFPGHLPTTANAFQQTSLSTLSSPFLAVFNSQGTALTYCSYLGGSGNGDRAFAIAVDGSGAAYISGVTSSSDFPTTPGAYQTQPVPQSSSAAFLAKFDPTKSGSGSLVYSTELGGAYANQGAIDEVAVDTAGNAYVAVEGDHTYPVTSGAYQNPGGSADFTTYVSKVNPTGSGLVYSASLGLGLPTSIAVDGSGSTYVSGTVASPSTFPTTKGAYQTAYGHGFLSKLSSDGTRLEFSTLLGGPSEVDFITTSMALPPGCATNCSALIAGVTPQSDLPQVAPLQAAPPALGENNAFLIQVNAAGTGVSLSSYFGGNQTNVSIESPGNEGMSSFAIPGVSLDSAGNIYLALNIASVYGEANEPRTRPLPLNPGYEYIAKLAPGAGGLAVVTPASINFADTAAGTSNASDANVMLQNTGSGTLHLFPPFQLSSPDITEIDNCPAALNPGESCRLTLSFTPISAGQDTGTLSILSDAVDSPSVQLSGRGIEPAPLAPLFSLSSTTTPYFALQTLAITDLAPQAVIHYTTDGTMPTSASPIYSGPLTLMGTTTVKAFAIDVGVTSPVTTETYTIYSSYPLIFRSRGFNPGDLVLNGATIDQSYHLQLTDGGVNEARSAWFPTPMPVSAFTTDFTFQLLNAAADGFTFTLQSVGPKALGKDGSGLGYQGIGKSVALKFDLHNTAGEGADSVGLFVNGAAPTVPANNLTPSGINLHSGDVMQAHVVYDGTTLRLTLTDMATHASSTTSYPVNIPGIVGGDSAYVGFTAGTGALAATQDILSLEFVDDRGAASQTPVPAIYLIPGSSPPMIALADAVPGAAIYYTTDGTTTPTTASQRYSSPFVLSNLGTVQAIAVPGTGSPSAISTEYVSNLFPSPLFAYGRNSLALETLQSQGVNIGPSVIDGRIVLTDLHPAEANSVWYQQLVSVGSFTTEFTFQLLQASADGFTFTLQKAAPRALGKDGGGLGYQGIPQSVAVKFDLHNNAGEGANSVGLYLNGAAPTVPANNLTPSGVNLHSGDVMKARLTYDGKTLTLTLTDTATQATASFPYAVDIPGTLRSSVGYIGFTGGTGTASAIQQILSWSYGP